MDEPRPNSTGEENIASAAADIHSVPKETLCPGREENATVASSIGWKDWFFAVALTVTVFLVYQPAWHGGLIWDDTEHVTRLELRSWHGLYRIWFDVGATPQYYPLVHSVFWVEHKLWGDSPLNYHLATIFLHVTAALMVARILRGLAIPGAYLAAAIFALHPVQVESVAWITEIKNTLSAVLYLGAAMLYLRFDRARNTASYLAALGLFLLALACKTVTGTLPGALLVIFWWQRGRLSWAKDVLPLAPFFLLGASMGMVTAWWELAINKCVGPEFEFTPVERILIAGRGVWFHLGKFFWPANLTFIYPRWQIDAGAWWQYLFPISAAALLAVTWAIRRWTRAPLAALLFFGGTLFPVMGFFNLYTFRFSFIADHYQYLACLGIISLLSAAAALLQQGAKGWGKLLRQGGTVALLALLAVLSWRQSRMYADVETLYRTTIERNPACYMAHFNLAVVLADRGQIDEAIAQYRRTLEVKPDSADAHCNLGLALARLGRVDEALVHYRRATEIKPDFALAHSNLGAVLASRGKVDEAIGHYLAALKIQRDDAETHINLGAALAGRGQLDEAIAQYQKALEIKPNFALAHRNLGIVLASRGKVDEAIGHYLAALKIQPDDAETHVNLGAVLAGREQLDEAIAHYQKALELNPDSVSAHNNFGNALASREQLDSAIAHYRKALQVDPHDADVCCNLANALTRHGQLDEAIAQYQTALKIKPDFAEVHCNLGNVLVSRGRADEALEHFQEALRLASSQNNRALCDAIQARIRFLRPVAPAGNMR